MPLTLRRGRVTAILEEVPGLLRLEVDGARCVAYPQLTGEVEVGDDVLVNVQARELALGSGGFDVLHANLTRGLELAPEPGAHVMKLPYTPLQLAVAHGEERDALEPGLPSLEGVAVVACTLHSQVVPVAAALRGLRVAYVQLAGGALPVALSDSLRALRDRGLLETTVGVGACFGGDVDCVNVYSGLAVARAAGAQVVVCGIGPGIVGTGTLLGHGGMAAVEALGAAAALGGHAVLALRMSGADPRERHRGVSHHVRGIVELSSGPFEVAWPDGGPFESPAAVGATVVDVSGWRDACEGLPLSHMGRGPDDDPWFFASAYAAGLVARRVVA